MLTNSFSLIYSNDVPGTVVTVRSEVGFVKLKLLKDDIVRE